MSLLLRSSSPVRLRFDFAKHLNGDGEIGVEIAPHDVQNLQQDRIPERVKNLVAVFSIHHDLPAAQNRQVLRKVRLFDAESFLYGAGGNLAFSQHFHNRNSGGV